MPRKRAEDFVSHLNSDERAEVLGEVLKRHPELREEANAIAQDLIQEVSVEAVAEEVAYLVTAIDLEKLEGRAGRHDWGYVGPDEAAWELLEESLDSVQGDMRRRFKAGKERAAEKICQGIILGLHGTRNKESGVALEWAPDFPAEAAVDAVSMLVEMYPQDRRKAAGRRVIAAVEEDAGQWVEMLRGAVERTASTTRPRRK